MTCVLYPIPERKHMKTQNCTRRVKYHEYIQITKAKASMLLFHEHTHMHLKQNRQKIARVPRVIYVEIELSALLIPMFTSCPGRPTGTEHTQMKEQFST